MLARSAARPRRQNSHRADKVKRCPGFLQWVRGRACALEGKAGHRCDGAVRACHVDYAGDKGMGTKTHDKNAIPMCDGAHREQHGIGWAPFETRWDFSAIDLAWKLWRHWLERTEMGAKWKARDQ